MVHTSPLDQAGTGDAGGMNIYVVEAAQNMAAMGVAVDIFTRRTNNQVADIVDVAPGVRVIQLNVGPVSGVTKEQLPSYIPELSVAFRQALQAETYDVIHSHYWISGKVAMPVAKELDIPLIHTMHTMARVKNLNLAEGESPEPMIRVQGETQVVAAADALVANTDAEAASLVSLYEACPDNVSVVSPGVNLKVFTPGAGRASARKELGLDPTVMSYEPGVFNAPEPTPAYGAAGYGMDYGQGYAHGGLAKLHQKYAGGGAVSVYDPDEINDLANQILEGAYV